MSMKCATQIRPISYLKANAALVVRELAESREPMIVTTNGEAGLVIQDVASYQQNQQTMALLKLLAIGQQEIDVGAVRPLTDVLKKLRARNARESGGST
jgi:prevent-host-death family protein